MEFDGKQKIAFKWFFYLLEKLDVEETYNLGNKYEDWSDVYDYFKNKNYDI